jgi:regulator of Ty1 transposition protein 103
LEFSPVMAEAMATAYKDASADVRNKLAKVVKVWRDRMIFEPPIQDAVEARLNGT